jgi:hypothetical protein
MFKHSLIYVIVNYDLINIFFSKDEVKEGQEQPAL